MLVFMQWQLPLTLFEIIIVGMIIVSVVRIQKWPIYTFINSYIKAETNYLLNLFISVCLNLHIILYRQVSKLHWVMPACTSQKLLSLASELLTHLAYNIMCDSLIFTDSNWMFPNSAVSIIKPQDTWYSGFIPSMNGSFFWKFNSHATKKIGVAIPM